MNEDSGPFLMPYERIHFYKDLRTFSQKYMVLFFSFINAMIHRDYFFSSNIQVHITPERVEIVNPGKLLFPKEELGKRSAQRNPFLTDMVHRLGMVEKAGSGIKRMRKLMKEYDLELDFEIGSFFTAVFHRKLHGKSDANPTKTG